MKDRVFGKIRLDEGKRLILNSYSKLFDYFSENFCRKQDLRERFRDTNLGDLFISDLMFRENYILKKLPDFRFPEWRIRRARNRIDEAITKYIADPNDEVYKKRLSQNISRV